MGLAAPAVAVPPGQATVEGNLDAIDLQSDGTGTFVLQGVPFTFDNKTVFNREEGAAGLAPGDFIAVRYSIVDDSRLAAKVSQKKPPKNQSG